MWWESHFKELFQSSPFLAVEHCLSTALAKTLIVSVFCASWTLRGGSGGESRRAPKLRQGDTKQVLREEQMKKALARQISLSVMHVMWWMFSLCAMYKSLFFNRTVSKKVHSSKLTKHLVRCYADIELCFREALLCELVVVECQVFSMHRSHIFWNTVLLTDFTMK